MRSHWIVDIYLCLLTKADNRSTNILSIFEKSTSIDSIIVLTITRYSKQLFSLMKKSICFFICFTKMLKIKWKFTYEAHVYVFTSILLVIEPNVSKAKKRGKKTRLHLLIRLKTNALCFDSLLKVVLSFGPSTLSVASEGKTASGSSE